MTTPLNANASLHAARDLAKGARADAGRNAQEAIDRLKRKQAETAPDPAAARGRDARSEAGGRLPGASGQAGAAADESDAAAVDQAEIASRRDPSGLALALRRQVDEIMARIDRDQASGSFGFSAREASGQSALASAPPASPMADFLARMGLPATEQGLLDAGALPANGFFAAQANFSLNLSVMQQVSTAGGATTSMFQYSLQMSMSWMGVGAGAAGANGPGSVNDFLNIFGLGAGTAQTGTAQGSQSPSAGSIWDGFMEYFNPANTADRILNFATSFYPGSRFATAEGGDTEANRQSFSDFIGAAIQKGFDQAMGILGKVDSKTQAGIDETHQRVFGGLADFVKNGLAPAQQEAAGLAQSWFMSLEVNYSYSQTTVTRYNANGQALPAAANAPRLHTEA